VVGGLEAVGDRDHRASPEYRCQGLFCTASRSGVQLGGGFVEDHGVWVGEDYPGQGKLLRSGTVHDGGAADLGVQVGQVGGPDGLQSGRHLLVGGVRPGDPQVVAHGVVEDVVVLGDEYDVL